MLLPSGYNAQGKPFAITEYLRYHNILSYEKQVETLCSKGFALWDIISSCERKGSLDKDIKKEIPNDIQGFCEQHPHLKRIVLANGGSGSTLFARHFADWWATGDLTHGGNAESVTAFQKLERKVKQHSNNPVVCICALSVSPAAARYDYVTKRDFWEQNVYQPGIELHEQLERETKVGAPGEKSAVNKDITLS
jgi:hypoxanthine-DNA glycosylase